MDPVFLIAGASSGIGAATARAAASAGYRLVLAARREDKLADLAEALGGEERALAVPTDMTRYDQVEALVERTRAAFGRIDVVFANAGVGHPRGFEAGDPEDAKRMVLINVFGVYATIRATAAALRATRGHLVLTSSVAGRRALKGSLYSATKFAVTGMAEAARQDFNGTDRRGHRPRRAVRRRAAAPHGHQRDPDPPDRAGLLNHPFGRWHGGARPVASPRCSTRCSRPPGPSAGTRRSRRR
jgi:NADP-dependent 3-hydroxy acid dehydrogenase YdfG